MYIVTTSWKHNEPIDPEKMTAHLTSLKGSQEGVVDEMRSHFFWVNRLIMFPTRRYYVHRRILVKSKFCSTARKDARKREQDIIKISKKAIYFMKLLL